MMQWHTCVLKSKSRLDLSPKVVGVHLKGPVWGSKILSRHKINNNKCQNNIKKCLNTLLLKTLVTGCLTLVGRQFTEIKVDQKGGDHPGFLELEDFLVKLPENCYIQEPISCFKHKQEKKAAFTNKKDSKSSLFLKDSFSLDLCIS